LNSSFVSINVTAVGGGGVGCTMMESIDIV
jgi:hypothetical protein